MASSQRRASLSNRSSGRNTPAAAAEPSEVFIPSIITNSTGVIIPRRNVGFQSPIADIDTSSVARSYADQHIGTSSFNEVTPNIVQVNHPSKLLEPVVIAIFGKTGTGKTSFIQSVTGQNMEIGHTLESSTKDVNPVAWEVNGRQVVLVDTPGFDDTAVSDTQILTIIAEWLRDIYDKSKLLSGIIYLHRITDTRMDPASKKSLRMFKSMCGTNNLNKVVLATTMWEQTNEVDGSRREQDLQKNYWAEMIGKGSRIARVSSDQKDAQRLVKSLIGNEVLVMKMQMELKEGKKLMNTEAGSELRDEMERMRVKHMKELNALREEIKDAKDAHDSQLQKELTAEIDEVRKKLEQLENENESLKKAESSTLPRNSVRGLLNHYWICCGDGCHHRTSKLGVYTCKKCKLVQKNTRY